MHLAPLPFKYLSPFRAPSFVPGSATENLTNVPALSEAMLEVLCSGGTKEYLYWDSSQVLARAVVTETEEVAEIKLINVSRHCRGSGIGSLLLSKIISDYRHKNLTVWTFSGRSGWYLRNGFTVQEENAGLVKLVRCGSP